MKRPHSPQNPRRIAVVAFAGAQVLDVAGPLEVFSGANRWLAQQRGLPPFYELEVVAHKPGPIQTSGALTLVADRGFRAAPQPIDTLLVAGGAGVDGAAKDPSILRWIARTARQARRVGSVCSGAFLLAAAGLLDGLRVATHWARCDELERRYPTLRVDRHSLYVRDGKCITSAGITAGIDLALSLVEEDLDRAVALAVARYLVVFRYRSGSQSQFSSHLAAQFAEREPLRDVQLFVVDNPAADLSVAALSRRAGMSGRHFARVFTEAVGSTPARYVESVRVDAAREMLEQSARPVKEVAARCGFGTEESMRRRFLARLGIAPSIYRQRFADQRENG